MNILVTKICKKTGLVTKGEEFDSETWKAKIVFMLAQLLFTLFTLIPCYFLYTNYTLSFIYICCIYSWCIWRGGSYYIEVFSERYKLKFIQQKEDSGEHMEEELDEEEHSEFYDAIKEALQEHTEEAEKK